MMRRHVNGDKNPPNDRNENRKDIHLCTSQDNLARYEYEQYDLGLNHTIDQTREQLVVMRQQKRKTR